MLEVVLWTVGPWGERTEISPVHSNLVEVQGRTGLQDLHPTDVRLVVDVGQDGTHDGRQGRETDRKTRREGGRGTGWGGRIGDVTGERVGDGTGKRTGDRDTGR